MLLLLLVLSATACLVAAGPDNIDVQENTIDMSAARDIADRAVDGLEGILGSLAGGVAGAALQGGGINLTALLQSSGLGSVLLPILGSTLGGLIANKLAEGEKYASYYGDKHDGDGVLATWGGIGPDGRPSVGGIVARTGATPGAKQTNVLLPPAYVMSFNKRPGLYAAGIMSGYKRPTTSAPPPTTTTTEPANIRPAILSALEEYFSTLTVTPPEKTSTPFTDDDDFDDYDDDDDDWYSTDGSVHSTSTASAVTKPKTEKTSTTPSTTTKITKRTTTTTTMPKPSTPPATLKPKTTTTTPKPSSSPHPTHNYNHETTAATTHKPTRPPRPVPTTTTTPKPTRPPTPVPTTTTTLKPTRPPRPDHSYQNQSPMPPRPEYNNHYETTTTTTPKPTWPPRPDYHYNHESTETTTQEPTWPPRPDHNYYYESTTARPYPNYPASHRPPAYQTSSTTLVPLYEEYEGQNQDDDDHRYPSDDSDEYRYPDENGDYYRDPEGRPYHHYSKSEEYVGDTVGTVDTGKFSKSKDLERSHPPTHKSRRRTHGSSRTSTTEWPYHVARKPQWTREPLPSGSKWPPAPGRFLEDVYPEKE